MGCPRPSRCFASTSLASSLLIRTIVKAYALKTVQTTLTLKRLLKELFFWDGSGPRFNFVFDWKSIHIQQTVENADVKGKLPWSLAADSCRLLYRATCQQFSMQ